MDDWHEKAAALKNVQPGDRMSYVRSDGTVQTTTVDSISYKSGGYIPAPPLSLWRRIIRKMTPPRWRSPLPQGTFQPPTTTIRTTDPYWHAGDPVERAQEQVGKTLAAVEELYGGFVQEKP